MNERSGSAIISGMVAEADISTHDSVTSRKPSRGLSSRRKRRVASATARPAPALMAAAITKSMTAPSCTAQRPGDGQQIEQAEEGHHEPEDVRDG